MQVTTVTESYATGYNINLIIYNDIDMIYMYIGFVTDVTHSLVQARIPGKGLGLPPPFYIKRKNAVTTVTKLQKPYISVFVVKSWRKNVTANRPVAVTNPGLHDGSGVTTRPPFFALVGAVLRTPSSDENRDAAGTGAGRSAD